MKALLIVLLLGVAALAVVAEVAAPMLVESRVEERVRGNVAGAAGVDADAGRFPFVPRLLLDTEVRSLAVTLDEVTGYAVPFAEVTFELEGIHLDRDALFDGEVEVTDIDTGVATVAVDNEALGAIGGDVTANAAGIAVPELLLPCAPQAEESGDRVELSCEIQQVPSVLVRAAN